MFFFGKRTKKLLSVCCRAWEQADKSLFASFSSEKEDASFPKDYR
jgi:hypothetical protein